MWNYNLGVWVWELDMDETKGLLPFWKPVHLLSSSAFSVPVLVVACVYLHIPSLVAPLRKNKKLNEAVRSQLRWG
ncbi:hypothetical protein L873DRAFT_1801958 [Choiromyces venosus 120613-1]|uniref:Uncharacterized protein n=1 Tax=Choiromyces venosus 120613-1 TaxID=1336337 RepID=A0A3N4K283_9PEZI|nr:hypothetical protein L873DRAFT_1801958 [Choiromyces venosus 120613-1]